MTRWPKFLSFITLFIVAGLAAATIPETGAGQTAGTTALNGGEHWVNIGPSPILPDNWSGRVNDVAVDPADAAHWLIGAAGGGVWETHDSGATWAPRTDDQVSLAMGSIGFAGSTGVVYAGTGDSTGIPDAYGGMGLLKSTDGGATWAHVPGAPFERGGVSDVKADPANPNVVLVGSTFALFGRGEDSPRPQTLPGLYRSADGGLTWTHVLNEECLDIEVDPSDFNRQYASLGLRFLSTDPGRKGIYRSLDGGQTYTKVNGPWVSFPENAIGRGEIAIAPSNPNVAYVSIANVPAAGLLLGLLGLWKTTNAWDPVPTWVEIDLGQTDNGSGDYGFCGWFAGRFSNNCYYTQELIVDPADPGRLFAGGYGLWLFNGTSWFDLTGPLHLGQMAMAFAGGRLIAANGGGVYSTANAGSTWSNHNTPGLSITMFFEGSVDPGGGAIALGGTQDTGTVLWEGAAAWRKVFGGFGLFGNYGGDNAISPSHPGTNWIVSRLGDALYKTTDAGATFQLANAQIYTFGSGILPRFEMCPSDEDVMIFGWIRRLWRTDDLFSAINPTWSLNLELPFGIFRAMGFAASDPTCSTYAEGDFGTMRITSDSGATWTELDPLDQVPPRDITDFAFDPRDANILYVTLSGFDATITGRPGHLFKSTNALSGSATWTDISPAVDAPFNTVVLDPLNPDRVYAGTDYGVYRSPDGGTSWEKMGISTGMPNVAVWELQAASSRITAFTHGRGAFLLSAQGQCPGGPEPDADGDGVGDSCDNCPATPNSGQADGDEDGIGDACDACPADPLNDQDGDGLCAGVDACPTEAPAQGLDADANGCTDTIAGLIAIVEGLGLGPGVENGLVGKLSEARKALERGNSQSAINKLNDFISQVEGLRGDGLTDAQADLLVAYAENLIVLLS